MPIQRSLQEELTTAIRDFPGKLSDIRHELHSRPELQFKEERTAALIRDILDDQSLVVHPPFLGTDVVCTLQGEHPGPAILLRADMDALPMNDESGTHWQSEYPGVHHGCGHDGHMAMLTGTALALTRLRASIHGRVIFVFQPGEEGGAGGKKLLDAGLFETTGRPDAAFAIHGWPGLPEGALHSCPGSMMAAQDRFFIDIFGSGGHGALPQLSRDPVLTAASLIVELQSIVAREYDPRRPAVLSVCTVHGGTAENIIPDTVTLSGTTRYFDRGGRAFFEERVGEITDRVCKAHRTESSLKYLHGYIPLVNNKAMVDYAASSVRACLGSPAWSDDIDMQMTSEDFAYFLDEVPGAMMFLGLGEDWPGLHTEKFDFNDRVLEAGVKALASIVLSGGDASFPTIRE